MRKRIKGFFFTVVVLMMLTSTVYAAGWEKDEKGYWYQYEDGSYAQSGIRMVDGTNYAFDAQGYMLTGWQYISFNWYYFDPGTGAQVLGWRQIDGLWYYFKPDNQGIMHTYWLDIGKNRYYFDEKGVMQTGVFYLSDSTVGSTYAYQTDETGALIRNTIKHNGTKTIRYDENGVMMYRNDTTRQVSGAEGGSTWQYVLNERDMVSQQEENKVIILTTVQEKQDKLFDEYKVKVVAARTSVYAQRLMEWEKKVQTELQIFLPQQDIISYIGKVKAGRFCKFSDRDPDRDASWYDDFYSEYDDAKYDDNYEDWDYEYEDYYED